MVTHEQIEKIYNNGYRTGYRDAKQKFEKIIKLMKKRKCRENK